VLGVTRLCASAEGDSVKRVFSLKHRKIKISCSAQRGLLEGANEDGSIGISNSVWFRMGEASLFGAS
jgi:hypothetical protein